MKSPFLRIHGAGDVAHAIAWPIAKAIDATLKTNVQGCGGCKQRREQWNRAIPFDKSTKK